MAETFFKEVTVTQQKEINGLLFPKVLSPNPSLHYQLSALTDSIKAHKSWLELHLHQTGAILFRGFPLSSASDFNHFVEAFGYDPLPYVGSGVRKHVVGGVFTANEAPPNQKIQFHHEMAMQPEFPSKVFFFCEEEPVAGGETPIVLSHIIYEKMNQKYPLFVQRIEEQGLVYARVLTGDDDPSLPVGLGWKSKFSTHDKLIAEQRAAEGGVTLEWMEGGVVNVKTRPIPSIRYDETRQRKTWFNYLVSAYGGFENELNNDAAKTVSFEDGQPLPPHIVADCAKILDEECVAIPWKKGDVLIIDNLATLHARLPLITPPRRILASLCK